jgi:hypothetical protein
MRLLDYRPVTAAEMWARLLRAIAQGEAERAFRERERIAALERIGLRSGAGRA